MAYLEWMTEYEDDIKMYAKQMWIRANRMFLTMDHKSAKTSHEAFKFGVYSGLFKLQPRAQSNCLTDGPTYAYGMYKMGKKIFYNHGKMSAQDEFAWEDITQGFVHKCTL